MEPGMGRCTSQLGLELCPPKGHVEAPQYPIWALSGTRVPADVISQPREGWALMQRDRCPYKKGTFALRHTGHVIREADMGPGNTWGPQELGQEGPPQPYEEACPPWPQNRQGICFCRLKPPILWPFVTCSPRRLVHWPFPQCLC